MSSGKQLPTFRRTAVCSSYRIKQSTGVQSLLYPEDGNAMIHRNVSKYLPVYTSQHSTSSHVTNHDVSVSFEVVPTVQPETQQLANLKFRKAIVTYAASMAVFFITFVNIFLVLFCVIVYMVVCIVCFCVIL